MPESLFERVDLRFDGAPKNYQCIYVDIFQQVIKLVRNQCLDLTAVGVYTLVNHRRDLRIVIASDSGLHTLGDG